MHEVTEAYEGARISLKSGVSSPRAGQEGSVYKQAHNAATPQSGIVNYTIQDGTIYYYVGDGNTPESTKIYFSYSLKSNDY